MGKKLEPVSKTVVGNFVLNSKKDNRVFETTGYRLTQRLEQFVGLPSPTALLAGDGGRAAFNFN